KVCTAPPPARPGKRSRASDPARSRCRPELTAHTHERPDPRAGSAEPTLVSPKQAGPRGSSRAERIAKQRRPPRLDARADGLLDVQLYGRVSTSMPCPAGSRK